MRRDGWDVGQFGIALEQLTSVSVSSCRLWNSETAARHVYSAIPHAPSSKQQGHGWSSAQSPSAQPFRLCRCSAERVSWPNQAEPTSSGIVHHSAYRYPERDGLPPPSESAENYRQPIPAIAAPDSAVQFSVSVCISPTFFLMVALLNRCPDWSPSSHSM